MSFVRRQFIIVNVQNVSMNKMLDASGQENSATLTPPSGPNNEIKQISRLRIGKIPALLDGALNTNDFDVRRQYNKRNVICHNSSNYTNVSPHTFDILSFIARNALYSF